MVKSYSSQGIVLSRKKFSEADRIISIYTKHYGKLTLLAKGVRKPKSRKRGSLEVFSVIDFSVNKTKSIDILSEVQIVKSYKNIRNNLKKVLLGYFFAEVVSKITQEGEKNDKYYKFVLKNFDYLDTKNLKLKKLKLNFIKKSLEILGFWPKGKQMPDPEKFLLEVLERNINTQRIGKKVFNL